MGCFGYNRKELNEDQRKVIDEQMKYSFYKISIDGFEKGFGFLSLFPRGETKAKILISNCNCITEEIILEQKPIKLTAIYSDDYVLIDTSIQRVFYTNSKFDISIIELNDEDDLGRFENIKYLEFDDNINKEKISKYEDKDIYIPFISSDDPEQLNKSINEKNFTFDYPLGIIKSINEKNFTIRHNCNNIKENKFYFPILLLDNYKVIGFNFNREKGILLKKALEEFEKKLKELNKYEKKNNKIEENNKEEDHINSINETDEGHGNSKNKDLDNQINELIAKNRDKMKTNTTNHEKKKRKFE
jgi:hypothetical protein